MRRRTKIIVGISFIGVPLAAVTFLAWAMFGDQSSYEEHLAYHEKLPSAASDIAVYRQRNLSGLLNANFEITEADFIEWAKSLDCELEEADAAALIMVKDPLLQWLDCPTPPIFIINGLYGSQSSGKARLVYDRFMERGWLMRSNR